MHVGLPDNVILFHGRVILINISKQLLMDSHYSWCDSSVYMANDLIVIVSRSYLYFIVR